MSEGSVDITHQHSTHNQHIAHISRTVLSTSVVVSVLIVRQRSCSSSGRTVLHGLHACFKEKNRFTFVRVLCVVCCVVCCGTTTQNGTLEIVPKTGFNLPKSFDQPNFTALFDPLPHKHWD